MHNIPFSDEELKKAAILSHSAFSSSLPEPGEYPEHSFSKRFVRKMEPLFALERQRRVRTAVLRRVAAVFLTTLIGLSTWLAIDTEARAAAYKWIKEVFENVIIYRLADEPDAAGKPRYVLTWIPEGLELVECNDEDIWYGVFYLDEAGTTGFAFDVCYTSDSQAQLLIEPGQPVEKVRINGTEADFYPAYESSDTNNLIWFDEDHGVMFIIDANLDKNTMLKIAENISCEKK